MNNKLLYTAYHGSMKLARLKNSSEREAAAVEFLTVKGRMLPLDGDEQNPDTGLFEVPVTDRRGNCYEVASFKTKAQATRFIDALLLISKLKEI